MKLFHATGLLYDPGDLIQPGNWGHVILGQGASHPFLYRELVFERVRQEVAPTRLSRLNAFFGVRSVDDVQRYQQLTGAPFTYEVEVPDEADHCFGDLTVFDQMYTPGLGLDASLRLIEDYWNTTAESSSFAEVLVAAPATVLTRL